MIEKPSLTDDIAPDAISKAIEANAARATAPRRARRALKSTRTRVFCTLGPKGGIGKSFTCRALIDLIMTLGRPVRVVQVDRGRLLPDLYPEITSVVHLPSADEMRANPLAAIAAFSPLEEALEQCIEDGADLVIDIGAAQNVRMFVDYVARARFDAHLAANEVRPTVLLLMVAEPTAMDQSADLADVLMSVHPHAQIVVTLNGRDGRFQFRRGTQAHQIWSARVEPLLANRPALIVPAMAAGAWPAFEGQGWSFRAIIETSERDIAARLGESRAIAATLQGDVSEWIDMIWAGLTPLVTNATGDGDV